MKNIRNIVVLILIAATTVFFYSMSSYFWSGIAEPKSFRGVFGTLYMHFLNGWAPILTVAIPAGFIMGLMPSAPKRNLWPLFLGVVLFIYSFLFTHNYTLASMVPIFDQLLFLSHSFFFIFGALIGGVLISQLKQLTKTIKADEN